MSTGAGCALTLAPPALGFCCLHLIARRSPAAPPGTPSVTLTRLLPSLLLLEITRTFAATSARNDSRLPLPPFTLNASGLC